MLKNGDHLLDAARHERPMPAALAERLRAIPRERAVCRDVDRLFGAARARARGGPADAAAVAHLKTCARCETIYGAIAAAIRDAAREHPLPARLLDGLRGLARRRPVPRIFGELDLRWALAASVMMGILLQPLAADAGIWVRQARHGAGARAVALVDGSGDGAEAAIGGLRRLAKTGYDAGSERLVAYGATWKELYDKSRRVFAPGPNDNDPDLEMRLVPVQGEGDDS